MQNYSTYMKMIQSQLEEISHRTLRQGVMSFYYQVSSIPNNFYVPASVTECFF